LIAFKNYSGQEFLGLDFNKKEKQQNPSLTTSGLNKYVRHPLYFASVLIVWGYFLAKPDVTILIMTSVISVYLIIGTKLEEQKLIKEFGEQYKAYIKKVPMLLPFIPS
jgi:protein-S-isoprenylcysteine O-methyltransferase Ste14